MNNVKDFLLAPFSSMEAESIIVLINVIILVGVVLLAVGMFIVIYQRSQRRKGVIRALKMYMQVHPSDANLINEYESISSRMKDIFERVSCSRNQASFKTIVEIFQEVR